MPDAQLVFLADQLDRLFAECDVGAFVAISSKTNTHFLHRMETTWNCISTQAGGHVRIRCKREDFPSKAAQDESMRLTVGMLAGFIDVARSEADTIEGLLKLVGKAGVEVEHKTIREKPEDSPKDQASKLLDELVKKAEAFDRLIEDLSGFVPIESKIKKLAGLSLVESLKDFVIIPRAEWEELKK